MAEDGKQPMQAPGPGENTNGGSEGAGQSGGGPYPNPHTGKKAKGYEGGQTEVVQKSSGGEKK